MGSLVQVFRSNTKKERTVDGTGCFTGVVYTFSMWASKVIESLRPVCKKWTHHIWSEATNTTENDFSFRISLLSSWETLDVAAWLLWGCWVCIDILYLWHFCSCHLAENDPFVTTTGDLDFAESGWGGNYPNTSRKCRAVELNLKSYVWFASFALQAMMLLCFGVPWCSKGSASEPFSWRCCKVCTDSNFACVKLQRGKMQHRSDFGHRTFPNLNFAESCVWQAWALEPLPAHGGYVSRLFGKM